MKLSFFNSNSARKKQKLTSFNQESFHGFLSLTEDLWSMVIKYLDEKDLVRLAGSTVYFRNFVYSNIVVQNKVFKLENEGKLSQVSQFVKNALMNKNQEEPTIKEFIIGSAIYAELTTLLNNNLMEKIIEKAMKSEIFLNHVIASNLLTEDSIFALIEAKTGFELGVPKELIFSEYAPKIERLLPETSPVVDGVDSDLWGDERASDESRFKIVKPTINIGEILMEKALELDTVDARDNFSKTLKEAVILQTLVQFFKEQMNEIPCSFQIGRVSALVFKISAKDIEEKPVSMFDDMASIMCKNSDHPALLHLLQKLLELAFVNEKTFTMQDINFRDIGVKKIEHLSLMSLDGEETCYYEVTIAGIHNLNSFLKLVPIESHNSTLKDQTNIRDAIIAAREDKGEYLESSVAKILSTTQQMLEFYTKEERNALILNSTGIWSLVKNNMPLVEDKELFTLFSAWQTLLTPIVPIEIQRAAEQVFTKEVVQPLKLTCESQISAIEEDTTSFKL